MDNGAGSVVVGVDGSDSAAHALRWAAEHAAGVGAPLHAVMTFAWPADEDGGIPHGHQYREVLFEQHETQLEASVQTARAAFPGIEVTGTLEIGHPIPVLGRFARDARLLVVGSRGLGGFTGMLLGSVAVGLAARAQCPTVVVRGAELPRDPALPVVVGIDGSPTSEAAVAFAFAEASRRGLSLVAAHTWWIPYGLPAPIEWELFGDDEEALLAQRLAGWAEKYPDVDVRRVNARARPAEHLRELSDEAQLMVVGSRGRGGFAGLLLGSVSQALLHHAACPVAVIRPELETG